MWPSAMLGARRGMFAWLPSPSGWVGSFAAGLALTAGAPALAEAPNSGASSTWKFVRPRAESAATTERATTQSTSPDREADAPRELPRLAEARPLSSVQSDRHGAKLSWKRPAVTVRPATTDGKSSSMQTVSTGSRAEQHKPAPVRDLETKTSDALADPFGDGEKTGGENQQASHSESAGGVRFAKPLAGVRRAALIQPNELPAIEDGPALPEDGPAVDDAPAAVPGLQLDDALPGREPQKRRSLLPPGDDEDAAARADEDDEESLLQKELAQAPGSPTGPCPSPNDLKKIHEITDDISPDGDVFPQECNLGNSMYCPRNFAMTTYTWKASALCHKPLYFEQVAVERYGHTWPLIQPVVSAAHFFATVPILPYKMGIEPPTECIYALGYYEPGSCAPYMIYPIPITVRAALLEAGAWVGGIYLIP